jgi:hypothetical protein
MVPAFGAKFLTAVCGAREQLPTIVGNITLSLNAIQMQLLQLTYPDNEFTEWWLSVSEEGSRQSTRQRVSEVV